MKRRRKNTLLGFDLDELIQSSVRSLFESSDPTQADLKEKLKQKGKEEEKNNRNKIYKDAKTKEEGAVDEDDEMITPTAEPKKPVKVSEDKLPDINTEKIIEKLNGIRSGKSLKDEETKKSLKAYFQKLNGPERIALYAFLTGLDKVVGGSEGADVKTPHSPPFSVDMEKEKQAQKRPKAKGEKSTGGSGEDTPIVVGESASKRRILSCIRRNK